MCENLQPQSYMWFPPVPAFPLPTFQLYHNCRPKARLLRQLLNLLRPIAEFNSNAKLKRPVEFFKTQLGIDILYQILEFRIRKLTSVYDPFIKNGVLNKYNHIFPLLDYQHILSILIDNALNQNN